MNNAAILLLLLVAFGLLVLLGVGIGRSRGRQPSQADVLLMSAMTGAAAGFLLTLFLAAGPLLVFPGVAIGVILATLIAGRQWAQLGGFLAGGGLVVTGMQGYQLLNDALDPAVTYPGWTPVPLAIGVALSILGSSLVIAGCRPSRTVR